MKAEELVGKKFGYGPNAPTAVKSWNDSMMKAIYTIEEEDGKGDIIISYRKQDGCEKTGKSKMPVWYFNSRIEDGHFEFRDKPKKVVKPKNLFSMNDL